jgi:5-methylcytosine-specific restriction endonuclease McrA
MIDAGQVYQCSHPGCSVVENLTIDHKVPLSRGGNDDLSNLQFMCQPHNSAKGNRI